MDRNPVLQGKYQILYGILNKMPRKKRGERGRNKEKKKNSEKDAYY